MRRLRCLWRTRVGWRGSFLLLIAAFDFVYGWTRMIHPDPEFRAGEQYHLLAQVFPLDSVEASMIVWGMLWWFVGLVAGISAFLENDRWGFGAAIGIKVSWLFGNTYAWIQGLDGGGGIVAVWVFVLLITILESARAEPVVALDEWADRLHDTGEIGKIGDHNEP